MEDAPQDKVEEQKADDLEFRMVPQTSTSSAPAWKKVRTLSRREQNNHGS